MHKLISIFTLALLYVTITFGQAAVEIPFTVEDNDGNSVILAFGLDLTATSGIDPALGEVQQPPLPPTGVFDGRFVSRPGQSELGTGTLIDIRNASAFPYSGTYEHQIAFQTGGVGTEITITWSLPPEIVAGSVIQDLFGGVLGYDQPFVGNGSITVTNPALVTGLQIIVVYDNAGPIVPIPIFEIAPLSHDFGSVFVGSSDFIIATISNSGDADLVVQQPLDVGDFSVTGTFPITIAPSGAPEDVTITFAPTTLGFQSGDLEFVHNAAGTPYFFGVSGTGADASPIFRVDPTSLNFGNVTPGTPVDDMVTVYNDGLVDDLVINSATIAEAEFVVSPATATIPFGGSEVFTVTFTPPAVGNYTGTLVFDHNAAGSPDNVALEGDGYIPPAVFGLVFDEIEVDVYENASHFNYMHLLATDGPLHALQFNLATNQEIGDEIILTYQSIEKINANIMSSDWILETNVVRGTINANGASQDLIHVLLYNIQGTGDLPAGDYNELFKVTYKAAKLPPLTPVQTSTFKINNVEGSTWDGFPVAVAPSRDILTVNVLAAGGGYGDVNGDGCVDILDLMLVVDHIVERELLTGDEFDRANIAPWYPGDPLPTPDAVVNVQDLSVIQNIILTGLYPNGEPVSACGYLAKLEGAADATVTIFINSEGISTFVDAEIGIRGAQIEFRSVSNNPEDMIINTPLGQGYYLHLRADELLRTLMYDRTGQKSIDAGVNNFMADMPFALNNPNDVSIAKIVLVDINTEKMSNILVQVIYGEPNLPLDYILFQNYPNPFNPTTDVRFQIPETGNVTIKIYDMLGQEIRTLFSGVTQRGTYTVQWDGLNNTGSKMSSGTYIYRMTTGDFVQSKKMMLLK